MRIPFSVLVIATSVSMLDAGAATLGCSSDGALCRDYTPPSSFDPNVPKVSFVRDVMPVFANSCAFTSCHGTAFGDANGVFLGGTDPAKILAATVDVPSRALPSMVYVKPGVPHESFLMRKVDGSQCVLKASCVNGDCGKDMPRDEGRLDLESRDAIRRWIAQGAKKDE